MFGKYGFNVKANWILNTKFHYDPRKLTPAQRETYHHIVDGWCSAKGKPVDAAVLFMLVQASMLVGVDRQSIVESIWSTIGELLPEMSPQAQEQFGIWADEFDAEWSQQAQSRRNRRRLADAAMLQAAVLRQLEKRWEMNRRAPSNG
jgi:hypothetical protein